MWSPVIGGAENGSPRRVGQHTVVVVGGGPLADPECLLGVSHRTLHFGCGSDVRLVDAWIATPDTPLFTLEAYNTAAGTIGVLAADDVPKVTRLAHMFSAIVNVDGSEEVQRFATSIQVATFQGEPGLYWGLHHVLSTPPSATS